MTDITAAVARANARNYSGSGDWLDESGNSHDAAITGASWTDAGASSYFTFNGTSDLMTILSHADLNFSATDEWTIGIACRVTDVTPAASQHILAKRGGSDGWLLFNNTGGSGLVLIDGVTSGSVNDSKAMTGDGADTTLIGVRNNSDDDIEIFIDGVGSGSSTADTTTGGFSTANDVTIFASAVPGSYTAGRVYSYAIIRSPFTDAEVAALHSNLINQALPSNLGSPEGWGFVRMGFALFAARPRLVRPEGLLLPERLIIPGTA